MDGTGMYIHQQMVEDSIQELSVQELSEDGDEEFLWKIASSYANPVPRPRQSRRWYRHPRVV
jgi:hypothetical protein